MVVLEVVKVPRAKDDQVPDVPISFPPLENLHLEMIESKRKLKPNLPLVAPSKRPTGNLPRVSDPVPSGSQSDDDFELDDDSFRSDDASETRVPSPEASPQASPRPQKRQKERPPTPVESDHSDDAELVAELGDEASGAHEEKSHTEEKSSTSEPTPADEEEDLYAGLTPEEREAKEKDLYLWRFHTLKKQWRNKDIPVYTKHSDLQMMKDDYHRTVKELTLEDNVETYRSYLMSGFVAIEFVATQWIGIDLGGFTLQQTQMMTRYERLLIELGEKNTSNSLFSGLPVEIRLLGLVLFSAAIFYIGKIVSAKYGSTVGELFKSFTSQPPDPPKSQPTQPEEEPKRRMRGPRPMAA